MESPLAYLPIDRAHALVAGTDLPERTTGAALFADISGFTPLTEALAVELGPKRGAEELTVHLNRVYDALIGPLHRHRGTVIGFAGDAITCWLDGDDGRRATAVALAMQEAMEQFAEVRTRSGRIVSLGCKVAVAAGPVRRFVVGDPGYLLVDTLAGATLEHLASAEHHANRGDVVLWGPTADAIGGAVQISERRVDEQSGEHFAVVTGLTGSVPEDPWPVLDPNALPAETVQRWLLPPVAERLYGGRAEFLAELRPAVALFLRFGGLDYDTDPDAPARLNAFICHVGQLLARYRASLIQLTIGDKGSYLYAAFGAPIAHEDDAVRAGRVALELQELAAKTGYLTPPQIGITQGRMRAGAYGSWDRRTYGVLGDAVNLSARLMSAAGPGEILVSQLARQAMGDTFQWETRPSIRVKGKSEPVSLARLVARRSDLAPRLAEPRYALPMVGRQAELAVIAERQQLAWRGQGQVVALTAEAGLGKSRLAAEVVRSAHQQGFASYGGECESYGTQTPYLVWQPIWRALFDLKFNADDTAGMDSQDRGDKDPDCPSDLRHLRLIQHLTAKLNAIDPSLAPRAPLLGPVLNLPIPDNDFTAAFDRRLRKASLEGLLVDCLAAFALERPLLLVLEDLHWVDPLSHDLVENLARSIVNLPVLMLLVFRPPDQQQMQGFRLAGLPHFTEITLTEFTPEEATRLVELKVGQFLGETSQASAALIKRISDLAGGNPFYIEELLNYLRDLGIDPGNTEAVEALDLPTSLYSLILSRIDQLNERQKETIKVASVIGRLFKATMVWGVYPELGGRETVEADLALMGYLDLTPLDEPEPELTYLFKHVLTQQVAYESLLYATRAHLHEAIGAFIERTFPDRLDQYLALLAHHYDHTENLPKRREYLVKAGRAAQAAYANSSAADYFRRALPILPDSEQLPVLLDLIRVLDLLAQLDEGAKLAESALTLAERVGDRRGLAQAERSIGWFHAKRGAYAEAQAWMERSRDTYAEAGDTAMVSASLLELGQIAKRRGEYQEARRHTEESLRLADCLPDERERLKHRVQALGGLANLAHAAGDYATQRALDEDNLRIRRKLGDRPGAAGVCNNLAQAALNLGDMPRALRLTEESIAAYRELGDRYTLGLILNNYGYILSELGRYGDARGPLEESAAICRQMGDRAGLALTLNTLADALLDQGETHAALPLLDESLAIDRELNDPGAMVYLFEDYGGVAAALGQPVLALRLAAFAEALRNKIGAPVPPPQAKRIERMLQPARSVLDQATAAAAWSAGAGWTLEEALQAVPAAKQDE